MEVEIKAKIESLTELERKIVKMGAELVGEFVEEDTYYNHPCRDFATTDEALRIRRIKKNGKIEKVELTYKGPKVDRDTKSREEHTAELCDFEDIEQVINFLGFVKVANVKKQRKNYRFNGTTVSLDNVHNLGYFVEIECLGEYQPCRKKVLELADMLSIDNFERRSYLELTLQRGTA